jgi:hypothetical protein
VKPGVGEQSDRDRFLAAVAEQVQVDRVVELYLFQPIRQGGVESGVAVLAASPEGDAPAPSQPLGESADVQACTPDGTIESAESSGESREHPPASGHPTEREPAGDSPGPRYTVFTARYRHVLKGPERGRWEVTVVAEADAPLATVGAVVRGVQRRAGDVEPPEHLTGDALREVLGQGPAA